MRLNSVERIIIFRQGQFGDTLVVFPLMEALFRLLPGKHVVYCTNHFINQNFVQARDVLKLNPFISKVVTYNIEDSGFQKFKKLKHELQPKENDLLLYLPYSKVSKRQIIRDWIFFKCLGFKNTACFPEQWRWTDEYAKAVGRKDIVAPKETDRMISYVKRYGLKVECAERCTVKCDENWADKKLEEWGLKGKPLMAICPGSKMQSKRWPVERFAEVGKKWHEVSGVHFIVVGGEEDGYMAEKLVSEWPGYGVSICGSTISQTAAMLKRVKGYLGNDTGSMHLSALLGIPCVALFSDRAPAEIWYPYGPGHKVLRKKMECSNCGLLECYQDPSLCLSGISVDDVMNALKEIHL